MHAILFDLRFALRSLRKNAGFALFGITIMAFGIGANTAVFTMLNTVLLRPLPYEHAEQIVSIESFNGKTGQRGLLSAPNFHDLHDQSDSFNAMAYYGGQRLPVVVGDAEPETTSIVFVTPEFFRVFGAEPVYGRLFTTEESKLGGPPAVVVSHAFWQKHFGDMQGVTPAQQTLRMHGQSLPIVGVLPPNFHFPTYSAEIKTDIWILANTIFSEGENRSANVFPVVGRLKPGMSLARAQAQMTMIGERLESQYPESNRDKTIAVTPLREQIVRGVRPTLYLLLGGVAVLLLIACANMANLLLAKAAVRTQEIAVRSAVGATRGRILRQLLTESLLLAVLSGTAGLGVAFGLTRAFLALAPPNTPRLTETAIDGSVLTFTLVVCVLSSILFGSLPALVASRADLSTALKQNGTRGTPGRLGVLRRALMIGEIGLSIVLLMGAGLLTKSIIALNQVTLGFQPENLLVMQISMDVRDFEDARRINRVGQLLLAELKSIPGVSALGSLLVPPGRSFLRADYWIDRLPVQGGGNASAPQAILSPVAPGTFEALGVPLLAGRDFDDRDTFEQPFAAVINETLARQSFRGQDPIGHMLFGVLDNPKPTKIVGIVGDVRHYQGQDPLPEIYIPYLQHPFWGTDFSIVARTVDDPDRIAQTMRRVVRERAPDVPVSFTTAEELLQENLANPRFRTLLLSAFALLAVFLAIAGVYGAIAYVVGQRTSEIGLRVALGASRIDVLLLVLREGLIVVAGGLSIGLVASVATARLLSTMLFEVKPSDPLIYALVALAIGGASLIASFVPAFRATKVDPLIALRQD
jgi:putative ABC transport system permease protein